MIHKHPHILIIQNTHTLTHPPPFFSPPKRASRARTAPSLKKARRAQRVPHRVPHTAFTERVSTQRVSEELLGCGFTIQKQSHQHWGAVIKRHSFRGVNIINHVSFISNRWQLTASSAKIRAKQSRAEQSRPQHKLSLSLAITSNQDCKGASCKLRFGKKKILGQNWIYNRSGGVVGLCINGA